MPKAKKIALIGKNCVACGTCLKVCPRQANSVFKGISCVVDGAKCIGCGRCAAVCPANVITLAGGMGA
jgi:2-oxoglutarate ferredoxin oxidoreductase subunit delta